MQHFCCSVREETCWLNVFNSKNTLESLKSVIEKLSEASQSIATKIYEDTAKESDQHSNDGEEDVVDGEVVEDE